MSRTIKKHQLNSKVGANVQWFADRQNWPIAENNILVEGDNDRKYFILAAELYKKEYNRNLLSSELSIFPTGIGDAGGTLGIMRNYPTLRAIIDADLSPIRVVALFDNDIAGKKACTALTAKHLNFVLNKDIFLLHRKIPRTTRDPQHLYRLIKEENEPWQKLDCEIEDLVNIDMLEWFIEENSDVLEREAKYLNGMHHFKFRAHAKALLFRFVNERAALEDLNLVVDVLKSLRYFVKLDPDGEDLESESES